ncbi:MAG: tetratricopeptide repeat protein [Candidatus Latescibacterota bacterium]
MRKIGIGVLVLVIGSSLAPCAQAQVRAIGLGGAFVGVADDASAVRLNPAGIPLLQRQEYAFSYSDLYGLGLGSSVVSGVVPIGDNQAVGFEYLRRGLDDGELSWNRDLVTASYGYRVHNALSVGISGKYVRMEPGLDGRSMGKASGFGMDVGVLLSPMRGLRFGVNVCDVMGTSVQHDSEVSEEVSPRRVVSGVAFEPLERWLVAVDVDDRVHLGSEYWIGDNLALRGGFERAWKGGSSWISSVGGSLRYRFAQLDYAYQTHPFLSDTHQFSMSLLYHPAFVTIKDAVLRERPLFRSLYRYYEDRMLVDVVFRNSAHEELPVTVSIDVPTMTETTYEETCVLPAQTTKTFSFPIAFSDTLLLSSVSGYDNFVQPTVRVSYLKEGNRKTQTKKLESVYVLGRGKISWDDSQKIAAFITTEDPAVADFARGIVERYGELLETRFHRSNVGKAMVLFDALGAYGIRYNPDKRTPYLGIAADKSVLDDVKYPAELLEQKIGDCDDAVVLYSALLENLGIDTAVLDVFAPEAGHIYLMFDSGWNPASVSDYFTSDSEYVLWENRVWIPVETTMLGSSFVAAWRNGAEEYYRRKSENTLREIAVREASARYRPGRVRQMTVDLPGNASVEELLNVDAAAFEQRIERIALSQAISPDSAEGCYWAGAYYLRIHRMEKALKMMDCALERDPGFADALNAKGVILTQSGKYEEALALCQEALRLHPQDAGFRMNIALIYYLQNKRTEAVQEYERALELDPSQEGVFEFLKDDAPKGE